MLSEVKESIAEKRVRVEQMKVRIEQLREAKAKRIEEIKDLDERQVDIDDRVARVYPAYEKELLDRYLASKGNIRVFIRVRPILKNDYTAYAGTPD